jgi:hypothetical protein
VALLPIINNLNGLYASHSDLAAMLRNGLKDDPETVVKVPNKLAARIIKDDNNIRLPMASRNQSLLTPADHGW